MRLSDAIALGRTVVEPREGAEYFAGGAGCARGMALEAIGCRLQSTLQLSPVDVANYLEFEKAWPWTSQERTKPCTCTPIDADETSSISLWITHLFDSHVCRQKDWTLDQVIDWVRANEPAETVHADEKTIAELAPSLVAQG